MNIQWLKKRIKSKIEEATDSPVWSTASTLWARFEQDRLGVTASALTFTTVLTLVPFFAVVLSVFTAFPLFGRLRDALERWLVQSLIPKNIASNVMGYLTQFATKASELGLVGFAALFFTTISLMLTIDHTLNAIWRVNTPRPWAQRILMYWASLTLGPLVLGASLAITSFVITASRGWLPDLGMDFNLLLHLAQFLLMAAAMTLLYRYVPFTPVRWRHAMAGAAFVSLALGLGRWGMGVYLSRVPSYSVIYGAFATVPILLLWVYLSWWIVLFGAVIAAYLPSITNGVVRHENGPGWNFQLAAEILQALMQTHEGSGPGMTLPQLAKRIKVDELQLTPALQTLRNLDWVGELTTRSDNEDPRYVLLVRPNQQILKPLLEKLLLKPDVSLKRWWQRAQLDTMTVAQLLTQPEHES